MNNLVSEFLFIRDIFSYSIVEQNSFRYLQEYMAYVERHIKRISQSENALHRFMLIRLFSHYRLSNHQGITFSTLLSNDKPDSEKRLFEYHRLTGEHILTTNDYLKKIRFWRIAGLSPITGIGKSLGVFVVWGL